jgi:hypothetical protein
MAYKPTEADRNTVKTMVACGVRHEDIARCLGHTGIDDKTLRKHFREELDTASVRANSVIASRLYAAAERGEPWAVCFWLKTRARWRERFAMEHSGAEDGFRLIISSVLDEGKEPK